jgi:hypothetical protein
MLRIFGAIFLLILIAVGVVFGGSYWMTREAKPIAEPYINSLFKEWKPEAFLAVSSKILKNDPKAMQTLESTLAFMQQQLGSLKTYGALKEKFGFGIGETKNKGLYVYYQIDSSFEKANSKIFLTLSKEDGKWLISQFWVEPIPMPN